MFLHYLVKPEMLIRHMHTIELLWKESPEFNPPKLWPQNSPDLNIIDNSMWEISQEKVYKKGTLIWNYKRRH